MTAWFRHVAAAAQLEIQQVLTHPVEWLTAILAPLFWCAVLWFAFSAGTLSGLPVALVDLDQSAASRSVAQALDALPSIKLEQFENSLSADRALKNSKVFAVVTIPQDFETDRRRGAGAPVSIDINKSWYAVGTLLEVDFKTALSTLAIGHAAVNATTQGGTFAENSRHLRITTPDVYFLGNPAFNFVAYLLPTFIPGILALGALLAFISMLSREWRAGGIRRFMKLTQGSGSAVLAGKLLPWVIVFCTASSLWVAAFAGAAGWGAEGPIIFWLTASWLLILAMAGLAALVVSIAPTWVIALSAGICLIAPTFPFTGFSFPLDSMTPGAQLFGSLLPLTHYLQAQAQIWVLGSPLSAIAQTQLTLAAFPIILFAAAGPLFARRMRRLKKTEQMSSDLTAALEKSLEAHPAASGERTGFWKSFALTVRSAFLSRDTIAIFGGAVAFYLVFYGWPYSTQQIENVPVEIVDLDGSSASRRLIEAIGAPKRIERPGSGNGDLPQQGTNRRGNDSARLCRASRPRRKHHPPYFGQRCISREDSRYSGCRICRCSRRRTQNRSGLVADAGHSARLALGIGQYCAADAVPVPLQRNFGLRQLHRAGCRPDHPSGRYAHGHRHVARGLALASSAAQICVRCR